METTQPSLSHALIPTTIAEAYIPKVYFDQHSVYTTGQEVDAAEVLSSQFSLEAIDFLNNYLCETCLVLNGGA